MRLISAAVALSVFLLMGRIALGESAGECRPLGWDEFITPGLQNYEVVDRIDLANGSYMVGIRFGELTGQFGKLFLFLEFMDGCPLAAVSLGSYDATNSLLEGPRIYHLDLYEPEIHSTLGFYETPMDFQSVRTIAREVFEN